MAKKALTSHQIQVIRWALDRGGPTRLSVLRQLVADGVAADRRLLDLYLDFLDSRSGELARFVGTA